MELSKTSMECNEMKAGTKGSLTLDKDFNVPDLKEDIDKIIVAKGEVCLEECECMVDRVKLSGTVHYRILYTTPNEARPLCYMEGILPFAENVHMDGVLPTDHCRAHLDIDDLNISTVNSRKIAVKVLVGYVMQVYGEDQIEIATELSNANGMECLYKKLSYTRRMVDNKDVFRIKEEVALPQSKPNIGELLWYSVNLDSIETKLIDHAIMLEGELNLFVIYQSEDENEPLQYLTMEIPFDGSVDVAGADTQMVAVIETGLTDVEVLIKPDADGEERGLEVIASVTLDIQVYEDRQMTILSDVFAPNVEIIDEQTPFDYEMVLSKNAAKMRVAEKIRLNRNQDKMLQLCQAEGSVKVDEERVTEDGLQIDGVVLATIIYISANDRHPVSSMEAMIPFTYLVEMQNMRDQDRYEMHPRLEQLQAVMLDGDEIELKAQVGLDIVAFEKGQATGITELDVQPLPYEKIKALPAMTGYMVQDGDTLWSIAKKYYTTIDGIRQINHLENDDLKSGQKLLIVKN